MPGIPGTDADPVEAIHLDHLVGTDEMQILALCRLPSLRSPNSDYLDVPVISEDVVPGPNVAGESNLSRPATGLISRHEHSVLSRTACIQAPSGAVCRRQHGPEHGQSGRWFRT